jgi:hypothetical protein
MEKLKEDQRHSMSLTFGPREKQVFEEIDTLAEKQILPENRNEILRRGLHAARYLAEIDERPLLDLLSQHLHLAIKSSSPEELAIARSLSFAIYSIMIAKYGILRAEIFETIPMNLRLLEQIDRSKIGKDRVTKSLGELATSLDTIFLKESLKKLSNK